MAKQKKVEAAPVGVPGGEPPPLPSASDQTDSPATVPMPPPPQGQAAPESAPPEPVPPTPPEWIEVAERVRHLWHEGNTGIVKAGVELAQFKATLVSEKGSAADRDAGYKEWRRFYERTLRWQQHQVERVVSVGQAFGQHLDLVGQFDVSAMYLLSTKPKDTLDAALAAAGAGEFVSHEIARDKIKRDWRSKTVKVKKGGKGRTKRPKTYEVPIEAGKVIIKAQHVRLADVRAALEAALAEIARRMAKLHKSA